MMSKLKPANAWKNSAGFTIPEVIVAGSIMIILCVGTLTAFSFAIKVNRGNNLRMQALAVLQLEVEFYRSMKFVPIGSDARLNGGTYTNVRQRTSSDGRVFDITVVIDNIAGDSALPEPDTGNESTTTFKEIKIKATPVAVEGQGWLQDLGTKITIQRVRSN